tara:strand:- start:3524 stop:4390 length:867 start_codon:yes stop_codon:yes gene_type:complete
VAVDTYALTSLTNVKSYLGITNSDDDTLLENCINRASDWVESYCDRKFKARTFYEWHDGSGLRQLRLRNWPIRYTSFVAFGSQNAFSVASNVSSDLAASISISSDEVRLLRVASNGTETETTFDLTASAYDSTSELSAAIESTTGFTSTLATNVPSRWLHCLQGRDVKTTTLNATFPPDSENEYRVDTDKGIVFLRSSSHFDVEFGDQPGRLPRSRQSVLVVYNAGYSSIPDDIEQAALEFVQKVYSMRSHDPNVSNEGLGDYNYSLRPSAEVLATIGSVLEPHKGIR